MTGHAIRQGFIEAVSLSLILRYGMIEMCGNGKGGSQCKGSNLNRNGIGRGCCVQRRVNSFL